MRGVFLVFGLAASVFAQNDSWLTYHGDYSGRRNSPLTQVTPENVTSLKQAWKFVFAGAGRRVDQVDADPHGWRAVSDDAG
jgi:glucose dehydrogenase